MLKTKADLRVLVRPVVTFAVPKRYGDIRGTPADISRAKTLMGWEPAVDWEAAVSRTVSWFSERLAVDSIVAAS